jgi:hypothetical protein
MREHNWADNYRFVPRHDQRVPHHEMRDPRQQTASASICASPSALCYNTVGALFLSTRI